MLLFRSLMSSFILKVEISKRLTKSPLNGNPLFGCRSFRSAAKILKDRSGPGRDFSRDRCNGTNVLVVMEQKNVTVGQIVKENRTYRYHKLVVLEVAFKPNHPGAVILETL